MSTNYTENFDLCQWEPTDPVIRTDFNADNAKIEAALTALEEAKQRLDRAAVTLAYYTGRLALKEMDSTGKHPPQRAMKCDIFSSASGRTLTGGVTVQNNTLVLSGAGKTGSMTTGATSITGPGWTQARMWIHFSGGTITPKLNGEAMTYVDNDYVTSASGEDCWEREYVWNGQGGTSASVTLELSTGTASSITVYDYYVVYFKIKRPPGHSARG